MNLWRYKNALFAKQKKWGGSLFGYRRVNLFLIKFINGSKLKKVEIRLAIMVFICQTTQRFRDGENAYTVTQRFKNFPKIYKPLQNSRRPNIMSTVSRDSSVGIATHYGLGGPGIESQWGKIFRTCPERLWYSPSLLYNGYRVFPGGRVAAAWGLPLTPI